MLINPVFKKGDSCEPKSYRAIALLSMPWYVFNRTILEKIIEKTKRFTCNTLRLWIQITNRYQGCNLHYKTGHAKPEKEVLNYISIWLILKVNFTQSG